MKLRSVALVGVVCLAALGLIGTGAHAVFTTSTTSSQTITAGTWVTTPPATTPTVTITYPCNCQTYNATTWTGKVTGTASSKSGSGATITGVSVAIENTTTGKWWSGSSFSDSSEYFAEASGTTSWSLGLAGSTLVTKDAYSVVAEATDSLGNVGTSSTVSFTYCLKTSPPSVTITYPVNKTTYGTNWTGTITGSASAGARATIKSVSVAVEDTTTKLWWSGTGTTFTASKETFVPATGTTPWMLTLTAILTSGHSYAVIAEATNNLGNIGTSATVDFSYCVKTSPPTVTITYPVNNTTYGANWTGIFTGTAAAGTGATISKTQLSIEDTTTKLWWNGTAFAASAQTWVPVVGTATWSTQAVSLTSDNTYAVIAEATDNLNNTGTSSRVTFTYNCSPPTVAITYPVNNTTYGTSWTNTITGTASSNAGAGTSITAVSVAVENTTTGKWWNGTSFTLGSQTSVTTSGTTSWTLPLLAKYLTSGDAYSVIAKATDSAGNTGTSSVMTFTYNTSPSTVAITYPVINTSYGTNWGGSITGTAAVNASGATITKVKVSIEQVGGSCWTGSGNSYTASCPNYVAVTSGTTSWSLTLPKSDLTSGDSYEVTVEATDSYGNLGTSPTVTFTYNTALPSVTITYPANTTAYGSNWAGSISGTAASNARAGTSITGVSVAVENTTTGKWWNGTSFSGASQSLQTATGTTSWSLPLGGSSLTSGDAYSVIAEATDSAGNTGTSSTMTFTYCVKTSPPTVMITYPVNNAKYGSNRAGSITGTASSNAGAGTAITGVSVAVENTTTKRWRNGSSFSTTSQTYVAVSGSTTSWSLPLATKSLTSGDSYSVTAQATDSLKSVGTSSTVTFTYYAKAAPPTFSRVCPSHMGDCGGPFSTGFWWTITGTNFVSNAKVSFPRIGPSADFSVVSGSVTVIDSTTMVLRVRGTWATKGQATVVVTNPGDVRAHGSIIATGKPDPASLSIISPSDVAQGTHTTLSLKVSGTSCSTWGRFAVYFSNPSITGGKAGCSGRIVSVPITVSSRALLGEGSVTVLAESKDFVVSTNGLTVEVTPRG